MHDPLTAHPILQRRCRRQPCGLPPNQRHRRQSACGCVPVRQRVSCAGAPASGYLPVRPPKCFDNDRSLRRMPEKPPLFRGEGDADICPFRHGFSPVKPVCRTMSYKKYLMAIEGCGLSGLLIPEKPLCLPGCLYQRAGFAATFLMFVFRHRIGHDPGTGLDVQHLVL